MSWNLRSINWAVFKPTNPCTFGKCINYFGGFTCECDKGYEGLYCDTNIDDCADSPCHNGGTCIDTVGSFFCSCTEGESWPYSGLILTVGHFFGCSVQQTNRTYFFHDTCVHPLCAIRAPGPYKLIKFDVCITGVLKHSTFDAKLFLSMPLQGQVPLKIK